MAAKEFSVEAIQGIREISPGDDLVTVIAEAIRGRVRDGDIVTVTSKIVSKAEGRIVAAADREEAITRETVRIVATKTHPGGVTRIVENRLGLVQAAAGVDASNTPDGTVLLLPLNPDQSALDLCEQLRLRLGKSLGVVITDTMGRAWRLGQTDVAIGAAGVQVIDDLEGMTDDFGNRLVATAAAVADEIAGAANLLAGKTNRCPVTLVHGLGHLVIESGADGASSLIRPTKDDLFWLGANEAYAAGLSRQKPRGKQ